MEIQSENAPDNYLDIYRVVTVNATGWSDLEPNEVNDSFIRDAVSAGGAVLDIGAAYGVSTLPALAEGAHVVGLGNLHALYSMTPSLHRHRLRLV